MKKSFWAARPFGYGDKYPMLDVGQVIPDLEPGQQPNDEKLIRLGLLREVKSDEKPVQCGKCGSLFVNDSHLNRHGRNHHSASYINMGRSESSDMDAKTAEEIGKLRAMEAADDFATGAIPLHLDKTKATLEAGKHRASR